MKKEIRIYTKNDIITIENVYQYNIYHKANIFEVNISTYDKKNRYHLKTKRYNLDNIIQIDIISKINNMISTDFILF